MAVIKPFVTNIKRRLHDKITELENLKMTMPTARGVTGSKNPIDG